MFFASVMYYKYSLFSGELIRVVEQNWDYVLRLVLQMCLSSILGQSSLSPENYKFNPRT